jgi:very-short-patch-repair endonuclease
VNLIVSKSNKKKRQELRNNMTLSEIILWQRLKGKRLGFKFRRQHGIGPYIVDFYCPALRLVIELDGEVHGISSVKERDIKRQKFLESLNLIIMRYLNEMILENLEAVVQDIYNACLQLTTPSPSLEKRGIFDSWESPLEIRGRLKRGLKYGIL